MCRLSPASEGQAESLQVAPRVPNLLPKGGLRSEGDLTGGGGLQATSEGAAQDGHPLLTAFKEGQLASRKVSGHNSDISFRVSFLISNICCLEMFVSLGHLQLHLLPLAPDPSGCRRSVTVLVTPTWGPDPRPASHTGPLTPPSPPARGPEPHLQ